MSYYIIPVVSLRAAVAPLSFEALEAAAGARLDVALLIHRARGVTVAGLQSANLGDLGQVDSGCSNAIMSSANAPDRN